MVRRNFRKTDLVRHHSQKTSSCCLFFLQFLFPFLLSFPGFLTHFIIMNNSVRSSTILTKITHFEWSLMFYDQFKWIKHCWSFLFFIFLFRLLCNVWSREHRITNRETFTQCCDVRGKHARWREKSTYINWYAQDDKHFVH